MTKLQKMAMILYNRNIDIEKYSALQTLHEALNEAWVSFDPDDRNTHPEDESAPSGSPWLCSDEEGYQESASYDLDEWYEHGITYYADPADLMFKKVQ